MAVISVLGVNSSVFITETDSVYCSVRKWFVNRTDYVSFLGAFAKLRKATVSFVMHVCPSAWNNSAPTVRVLMKLDI